MSEASVQPEASTASVGSGIRYIGNHCYAYSGAVNVAQPSVGNTLLDFTTGSGYADMQFQYGRRDFSSDDIYFKIFLNSVQVQNTGNTASSSAELGQPLLLIIPPFTHVEVLARNVSANTDRECYALIRGRVYGAE